MIDTATPSPDYNTLSTSRTDFVRVRMVPRPSKLQPGVTTATSPPMERR